MKKINHKTAKVSDLINIQRAHLAWRLDHKTACGLVTACRIAKGITHSDKTLIEIFEWMGRSHRSASMHAKKVWGFEVRNDIH